LRLPQVLEATRETILATNTSSIVLSLLTTELSLEQRARVIGTHFFHPDGGWGRGGARVAVCPRGAIGAGQMVCVPAGNITPTVEIIPGDAAGDAARLCAMVIAGKREAWATATGCGGSCAVRSSCCCRGADVSGKVPVVVGDSVAFVVNRVQAPVYAMAACILIHGGASVERVDRALEKFGYPIGPFAQLDAVGLKTANLVGQSIAQQMGLPKREYDGLLDAMLSQGWAGRAFQGTSVGFYHWEQGHKQGINSEVRHCLEGGVAAARPTVDGLRRGQVKTRVQVVRSRLAAAAEQARGGGHLATPRLKPLSEAEVQEALLFTLLNEVRICRVAVARALGC
jgi:hypothetical protein